MACGILSSPTGDPNLPPVLEAWSLNPLDAAWGSPHKVSYLIIPCIGIVLISSSHWFGRKPLLTGWFFLSFLKRKNKRMRKKLMLSLWKRGNPLPKSPESGSPSAGSHSKPPLSPLVLKRCHVSTHQHNYAAPPPLGRTIPPPRRTSWTVAGSWNRSATTAKCASPRSSDTEENDKRRTHNVLERQRRNELKLPGTFLLFVTRSRVGEQWKKSPDSYPAKKPQHTSCRSKQRSGSFQKDVLRKRREQLKLKLEQIRNSCA